MFKAGIMHQVNIEFSKNIWGNKIKRQGHFLIQPVDVFPANDDQPGHRTDDYIKNPDTLQRPIFKNHTRAARLSIPKIL